MTLTPIGEDVLVAWADTRDSTEDGFADIYAASPLWTRRLLVSLARRIKLMVEKLAKF